MYLELKGITNYPAKTNTTLSTRTGPRYDVTNTSNRSEIYKYKNIRICGVKSVGNFKIMNIRCIGSFFLSYGPVLTIIGCTCKMKYIEGTT